MAFAASWMIKSDFITATEMRKHPASSRSHPGVAGKNKAGISNPAQQTEIDRREAPGGGLARTKTVCNIRAEGGAGCLPQQLGCLQVADTGATPPAPVTPPFLEVPGQTSSSSLPTTHREEKLWIVISRSRGRRIATHLKCQSAREVYPPVSLQINPPAGDGSKIDRMRSAALG